MGNGRVEAPAMARGWVAVALALFGAGLFVRAFPDHPAGVPMAVAGNLVMAAPAWRALRAWRGTRSAASLALLLGAYAYAIETVGVTTGVPYGAFRYGEGLGPLALGGVPVLLPLAYVPLVLGAVAVAGRVAGGDAAGAGAGHAGRPAPWRPAAVGALVLVACDLVLDPGAVRLGYWQYASGGRYHGVPASNFAGWLVTGAAAVALARAWLARDGASGAAPVPPPALATSAFLMMAFWTGIAVWHGLAVPALLGVVVTAALGAAGLARVAMPVPVSPTSRGATP